MFARLCVIAALVPLLLPGAAIAGMTAVSDFDLEEVTGQTGITITMNVTVTASSMAWGDSDGFGTYSTQGWVVLSSVTMPSVTLSGVTIDCGSDGSTSILQIDVGTGNLISGDMTVGNVIIGTTAASSTASLGQVRMVGLNVRTGAIRVSGH